MRLGVSLRVQTPTRGRSKRGSAHRSRETRLATGPGFRWAAPGTKNCPTCAGGAGTSPRAAPARTPEVTSGACQPEGGPAREGGTERSLPSHTFRREPTTEAEPPGSASHFRSPAHSYSYEGEGRDPGPPRRPAPGLLVPPQGRLRLQWGAPGFRLGEGVSTWSRLRNVSLSILRPLVPALGGGGLFPGKAEGAAAPSWCRSVGMRG